MNDRTVICASFTGDGTRTLGWTGRTDEGPLGIQVDVVPENGGQAVYVDGTRIEGISYADLITARNVHAYRLFAQEAANRLNTPVEVIPPAGYGIAASEFIPKAA